MRLYDRAEEVSLPVWPEDACLRRFAEELEQGPLFCDDIKGFGNFVDLSDDSSVVCIPAVH